MDQDLFIPDPEEVDAGVLQFCSCQLKLLQLYMDMEQLHSAPDGTSFSSNQVAIFWYLFDKAGRVLGFDLYLEKKKPSHSLSIRPPGMAMLE